MPAALRLVKPCPLGPCHRGHERQLLMPAFFAGTCRVAMARPRPMRPRREGKADRHLSGAHALYIVSLTRTPVGTLFFYANHPPVRNTKCPPRSLTAT